MSLTGPEPPLTENVFACAHSSISKRETPYQEAVSEGFLDYMVPGQAEKCSKRENFEKTEGVRLNREDCNQRYQRPVQGLHSQS